MAIAIDPTDAPKTTTITEPLKCDAVHVDRLTIDWTARDSGPPIAEAVVTPYKTGTPNVFSTESITLKTGDLFSLAKNVPEMGAAIAAIEAGFAALMPYVAKLGADYAQAVAARVQAETAEAAAADSVASLLAARTAAYAIRQSPEDPAWLAADKAWSDAVVTHEEAKAAIESAKSREATAKDAMTDPAKPPLK